MTTNRLETGDKAPDFTLADAQGGTVSLADYRGRNVILYFYPAAMSAGCTTEACDFTAARTPLDTRGYVVVGVSPDKPSQLVKFRTKESLDITLLSDPDHSVLEEYGAWGENTLDGKTIVGVIRSTFVIAPNGTIDMAWYNVKASGHVARVLGELGLAG